MFRLPYPAPLRGYWFFVWGRWATQFAVWRLNGWSACLSYRLAPTDTPTWGDLGKLASDIRNYVDADLVALASYENGSLKETVLSDQPAATRRATMPEKIGEEISGALSGARHVPGVYLSSNGDMTTAISAKQPRRNEKLLRGGSGGGVRTAAHGNE